MDSKILKQVFPLLDDDIDGAVFRAFERDFEQYVQIKDYEITEDEELMFARLWYKKYEQRVALVYQIDLPKFKGVPKEKVDSTFTMEQIEELQNVAEWNLIEHGELCGIALLARDLVYKTLSEYLAENHKNVTVSDMVGSILPSLLRNTRRLCETSGKLIFWKIDKGYLRSVIQ